MPERPADARGVMLCLAVGHLRQALALKLINNLLFAANAQLCAAATQLGGKLGVAPDVLLSTLQVCSARSHEADHSRIGGMDRLAELAGPFMSKDIAVCREAAAEAGVELGLLGTAVHEGPLALDHASAGADRRRVGSQGKSRSSPAPHEDRAAHTRYERPKKGPAVDLAAPLTDSVRYPSAIPDDLVETAEMVKAAGGRIMATAADIRDLDALRSAVDEGVEAYGRLDVIVANAGICMPMKPTFIAGPRSAMLTIKVQPHHTVRMTVTQM